MSERPPLIVRQLGLTDYQDVWHAMQDFTDNRDDTTPDEIWLVEHPPVFTQGQAGKEEHILNTGDIPVVKVDRGGQVTYHGPGQQVLYVLFDLKRMKIGVRELVTWLEQSVVRTLNDFGVDAYPKKDAPGVYVNDAKVASVGLRVRQGRTFHGLAMNVDMDMSPFLRINPCGYAGMQMVQSKTLGGPQTVLEAGTALVSHLVAQIKTTLSELEVIQQTGFENA